MIRSMLRKNPEHRPTVSLDLEGLLLHGQHPAQFLVSQKPLTTFSFSAQVN